MGHLEGNFTPVLYIERKVPEGYYCNEHQINSNELLVQAP